MGRKPNEKGRKRRERGFDTETEGSHVKKEAEAGGTRPQAPGRVETPEVGRLEDTREALPFEPAKEAQPCPDLDFGPQASRL